MRSFGLSKKSLNHDLRIGKSRLAGGILGEDTLQIEVILKKNRGRIMRGRVAKIEPLFQGLVVGLILHTEEEIPSSRPEKGKKENMLC